MNGKNSKSKTKPKSKPPTGRTHRETTKKRNKSQTHGPEFFQTAWFIVVFIVAALATISQIRSSPGSLGRALDSTADSRDPYANRLDDDASNPKTDKRGRP